MNITSPLAAALLVLVSACGTASNESNLEAAIPAGTLNCSFTQGNHAPYTLKGKVSPQGLLSVDLVTGGIEPKIGATGLVQSQIAPAAGKDGSLLFFVNARTDDSDFGDTFTVKLPKKLQRGSLPASIEHVYYSRTATPAHVLNGSCVLN